MEIFKFALTLPAYFIEFWAFINEDRFSIAGIDLEFSLLDLLTTGGITIIAGIVVWKLLAIVIPN